MATQSKAQTSVWISLAENGAFVLFAYFLVFGIWTLASGNDFISPNWKSVRRTRRLGQMHVLLVFLPMIYMVTYIIAQQKNGDYQEMGAALLALAFAVLHFIRTLVGLWQLHMFKKWAIASVQSMESLGYKARVLIDDRDASHFHDFDRDGSAGQEREIFNLHGLFCNTDSVSDQDTVESINSSTTESTSEVAETAIRRSDEIDNSEHSVKTPSVLALIADKILVNETLIDNRLTDVYTACYLNLLSEDEKHVVFQESSLGKRLCYRIWYSVCSILRLPNILLSLTFL